MFKSDSLAFTNGLNRIAHYLLQNDVNAERRELSDSGGGVHVHTMTKEEMDEMKHKGIEASQMAICFLFVTLMIGQLLHHCAHKIHFPYTPLVTIAGVIYGALDRKLFPEELTDAELDHANPYKQTLEGIHNPSPILVFLIFLPALIFESAFNSDWYTFKR